MKYRTEVGPFLYQLAVNLQWNDPWFNNDKHSCQAAFSLVLGLVDCFIRKDHFDPADPENLKELSPSQKESMVKRIEAGMMGVVGEKSGVLLTFLSQAGLGQVSIDRQFSSLGVNSPGQVLVIDCVAYNRYSIIMFFTFMLFKG